MQETERKARDLGSGARRLRIAYITALSAIAALTLLSHTVLHTAIHDQFEDGPLVNIAGRQRMLSQKIAKSAAALESEHALGFGDEEAAAEELRAALALWASSHDALRYGDAELGLTGNNPPEVESMYEELQPHFEALYASAYRVLQNREDLGALVDVLAAEKAYLPRMNEIVFAYAENSQAGVQRAETISTWLLYVTLTLLAIEAVFIFEPASRMLRRQVGAILKAQREAEAAASARSQLLANMSHEIRTPLNAIVGFVEVMAEETPAEHEHAESLGIVQRSSKHLMTLLNEILDVSKFEAGETTIDCVPTDLREVCSDSVRLFDARAQERGIALELEMQDAPVGLFTIDPVRLRQVVTNLVGNAVKFTEEGEVRITLTAEEGEGVVRVRDTGCGIPAESIDRIFEPFGQDDDTRKRVHGGTGLGLTLCRLIAEALDGSVGVESEPGVGSTFTFRFPLRAATIEKSAGSKDLSVDTLLEGRVLLVDDSPENRRLLSFLLTKKLGLHVEEAVDGVDAVEQALAARDRGEPHDLVLMDVLMPRMDGHEATRQLRAAGYVVPIVAVTAHALESDRKAATEAGCNTYLTKPIDRKHLYQVCAEYLSGSVRRKAA